MKLKNEKFANPNFMAALNEINKQKLPVRIAYKIVLLLKQLEEHGTIFNQIREKLLQQYGESKKNGDYIIDNQKMDLFKNEMEELLTTEFEINWEPLELPETIQLSPAELHALEGLFNFSNF